MEPFIAPVSYKLYDTALLEKYAHLPPHSVAIELKELENILSSFSEFVLLFGSQGVIGYKHRMATPS